MAVPSRATARTTPRAPTSPPRRRSAAPASAVHELQTRAGNAAVSRLIASDGGAHAAADRASGPVEAAAAFIRRAERTLPRGLAPPPPPRATPGPPGAAAQAQANTRPAAQALAGLKATPAPTAKPAAPRAAQAPADAIPVHQKPGSIAAEAASKRAPADAMTIPLAEAADRGPRSEQAMARLDGAPAGLVAFGAAINARIGALRDRAVGNAAAASADLRSETVGQREGVRAAVQSSRAAAEGIIRGTRGDVVAGAADARAASSARTQAARAAASATGAAEAARLDEAVATGRTDAQALFTTAESDVRGAGQKEGQRGRAHANDLGQQAVALGRQEAAAQRASEPDDADLAQRKADAVVEVAQHYAEQLRDDGASLASDVAEQADQAATQVTAESQTTVDGVGQVAAGGREGVTQLMTSVGQGIDGVEQQGRQQLDAAEAGALGEVDNLQQAAAGRGEAMLAEGEASLDAALAAGLVANAKIAGQAGEMLDEAGEGAIAELAQAAAAAPPAPVVARDTDPSSGSVATAPEPQAAALDALDAVGPGLDQSAASQSAELKQSVQGAAAGANQSGAAWVDETQNNMSRLGTTATTGLAQVADAAGTQAEQTLAEGTKQAGSEVDRVGGEVKRSVSDIRGQVDGGVGQAVDNLHAGTEEGVQHADSTFGEVPGAMREAAEAQESWWGRATSWISNQLSDTWKAIKGMADWKFVASLVVGIGAAILVGAGVALLIASAPFTLPGLAVVLLVGAAAGAAGFAAAQVTGNLLDPNPNTKWYSGVGHAAILGAFVGAAGAAATFYGLSLAAGTLVVMGAAGVGTVVANVSTGREWDDHLVANTLIIGIFHGVIKGITDRIPALSTEKNPAETRETSDYRPPPAGRAEVVVDNGARVTAGDLKASPDGWECDLSDSQTGARYGYAEVEKNADGTPKGGPHLTIDPTNARLPDGTPVTLKAQGFSWTVESLRAAVDAFRAKFSKGPADMGGLLAWKNLANFQQEFFDIRAANPGLAEGVVAERAARATSFGQHRIGMGYGDISVQYGNMGDVGALTNVPKWVEVSAKPTTPGVVPVKPGGRDDAGE
ncbi:MAG: hypothetical protein AAGC49_03070 [Brevundimonas sp.]